MKKLIAISVVFALVAGVAFAVDLSATVVGTVKVITADSDSGKVGGGGSATDGVIGNVTLEGAGEVEDGKFGGYVRIRPDNAFHSYYAWWKPIDQLKLYIGSFPDGYGFTEYNGNSCWMFYQSATDTGVSMGGAAAWGSMYGALWPFRMRQAFAHGFDAGGLAIQITPVEMLDINIGLPFFDGGEIADILKSTYAQIALKLSFGTFAFTFIGDADEIKNSEVFGYFSLTAIDNLTIDFGLGSNFNNEPKDGWDNISPRLNLGLVVKYGRDTWGIKFRSLFGVPVADTQKFGLFFEVLPYFVINDSLRAYVAGGVAIPNVKAIEAGAGWHVNPYLEVGGEWGPKFLAGIKVYQAGNIKSGGGAPVVFELPIALIVSF